MYGESGWLCRGTSELVRLVRTSVVEQRMSQEPGAGQVASWDVDGELALHAASNVAAGVGQAPCQPQACDRRYYLHCQCSLLLRPSLRKVDLRRRVPTETLTPA